MAGFDLASLMPYYLDETDEQIAGLGDALLKLEASPADDAALREAFRLIHTIKGSSMVLGFEPVKDLTHHLEAYFEALRSGKRSLDRASLDLCFKCLDALRDYHKDLRAKGESSVALDAWTAKVREIPQKTPGPEARAEVEPDEPERLPTGLEPLGTACLTVRFEPNLPWPDMKAKLVLNRVSSKARILVTEPSVERLEEIEALHWLRIWVAADDGVDELLALADVDGVVGIEAELVDGPGVAPAPAPVVETKPLVVDMTTAPEPDRMGPVAEPESIAEKGRPGAREALTVDPGPIPEANRDGDRAEAASGPRKKVAETVRVDVDRLDQLMNLAGELVISKARFTEIARGMDDLFRDSHAQLLAVDTVDRLDGIAQGLEGRDGSESLSNGSAARWAARIRRLRENFRAIEAELDLIRRGRERLGAMSEAIDHLSRISDGIQRGVLETRMVPIGPLFDRFHRVIRDLRRSSGKEIDLRTDGEKTELDKRMIDELGDPLVHLIRNAVDHGLERPEERRAVGKPEAGTVSLSASHRGNSVVVTVADDGRGIDLERVRRKAVAKGLIGEEESHRLSDRQIVQFIFHPGLSTAEAVTDISGRGVGMDIVKSRIESLNGAVDIRPEPGRGTTFIIRLPLTLAIISVLLAEVGEEVYAIPLDHLDEIVEVGRDQVHRVHGQRSFEIRGRITSLVALRDVIGAPGQASGDDGGRHTVVVVSDGDSTIGLIVDGLLGMQEAVLKSLSSNFRPVAGLSGASLLGDGRVCLILDVDALIEMAGAADGRTVAEAASAPRRGG